MSKAKQRQLVFVLWSDASYQGSNVDIENLDPVCELETSGQLIAEDKTHLTIALEKYVGINRFRHVVHIPKINIIRMRRIKVNCEA